jgi:hypothetical protein
MGSQSARLTARFTTTGRMAAYDVINDKGQDLGQVTTFIMDMKEGLIAFALVTIGGILGFGDKWFALPWGALKWDQKTNKFTLDMPEEILKNAPGMDKDKWREDMDKWRKEEDLAVIDNYYGPYGYESYRGIVRRISG